MANGEDIRRIYIAIKMICMETSQMLSSLEGELTRKAFNCQNAGGIFWDTSRNVASAQLWLPYFQQMVFASGDASKASRAIGVQILFDEPAGHIDLLLPIVLCGVLEWPLGRKPTGSNNFYNLCWIVKTLAEIEADPPFYKKHFPSNSDCSRATGYFLPLDALEDPTKLIALVVNPCLELFNGRIDSARSLVGAAALKPKEFIAEYSDPR